MYMEIKMSSNIMRKSKTQLKEKALKLTNSLKKRINFDEIIKYIEIASNKELIRIINELKQADKQINEAKKIIKLGKKVDIIKRFFKASLIKPRLIKKEVVDKIKFYTKIAYTYKNINSLRTFYDITKNILYNGHNKRNFTSLNIPIIKDNVNKGRAISITAEYFKTFEIFENRFNKITKGQLYGSEALSDEENIDFNRFSMSQATTAAYGEGSSEKILFKSYNIKSKDKKCVIECLKKCNVITDDLSLKELRKLIEYIQDNNLKINILANSFLIKKKLTDIFDNNEIKEITIYNKLRKEDETKEIAKLTMDDIKPIYIYKIDDAEQTIIFDEFNKHYDLLLDNKIELDDIYINMVNDLFKNNQMIMRTKQININAKITSDAKLEYLFFDYETVINYSKSNLMVPYSLSVLKCDEKDLTILQHIDNEKDIKSLETFRKTKCVTFTGFDCSEQFLKWFIKNQLDRRFLLVGYNNSNFDNHILIDDFLRLKSKYDISVSDIFYNGNSILNAKINGRHTLYDLNRHLIGSLKNNCESFKINIASKREFDHYKAQTLYDDNKLLDFVNNDDELIKYNEYDVISTALLYYKYKTCISTIPSLKEVNLNDKLTVGSLVFDLFKKQNKEIKLPKLKLDYYKDILKYKCAGRVELFNGVKEFDKMLHSFDVCSLYPYVMAILNVYYPCGELIETDKYKKDKIGFYYCDIDQSNLKKKNLPNIYPEKTETENIWNSEKILENYLISSVMIEQLKKYKCKVVIKNGFYFTDKIKSCDMFKFILDLMKKKNEQDDLKKIASPLYNPAMREMYKLLMNSVSGKIIEGLHLNKTEDISSESEFNKIEKDYKTKEVKEIAAIGDRIFINYDVKEEYLLHEQRPVFLGCLVYDYAKIHMFDYSYSLLGLKQSIYTDTDATKFKDKYYEEYTNKLKNIIVPHWEEVEEYDPRYKEHKLFNENSKVFGSFEDELKDMNNIEGDKTYKSYFVQKKSWAYIVNDKYKFKFKGLNEKSLPLYNMDILKEEKKEIKLNISSKELNKYYNDNKDKCLGASAENVKNFYGELKNKKYCFVVTTNIRKNVKNANIHKLQFNFMLKKITIQE